MSVKVREERSNRPRWLVAAILAVCVVAGLAGIGAAIADASPVPSPPPPSMPAKPRKSKPAQPNCAKQVLHMGSSGACVVKLQRSLHAHHLWVGDLDGAYGYYTQRAVINWQRYANIPDDGVAGPQTQRSLLRKPAIRRPAACRGVRYCNFDDLTNQLGYIVAPNYLLVAGISSGTEQRYHDKVDGKIHNGFAHTPRGTGVAMPEIPGNHASPLCPHGSTCMVDTRFVSIPGVPESTYANHGDTYVPARPASHGCVRWFIPVIKLYNKYLPSDKTVRVVIAGRFNPRTTLAPVDA